MNQPEGEKRGIWRRDAVVAVGPLAAGRGRRQALPLRGSPQGPAARARPAWPPRSSGSQRPHLRPPSGESASDWPARSGGSRGPMSGGQAVSRARRAAGVRPRRRRVCGPRRAEQRPPTPGNPRPARAATSDPPWSLAPVYLNSPAALLSARKGTEEAWVGPPRQLALASALMFPPAFVHLSPLAPLEFQPLLSSCPFPAACSRCSLSV